MDAEASTRRRQELPILTSYSDSVFLLASQMSMDKKPVELLPAPEKKGYVLQCEWPNFQLAFERVFVPLSELLLKCGVGRVGKVWSEPSPVFEVDFESQDSIQQMVECLESGKLCDGMKSLILPLAQRKWRLANPDAIPPAWNLDVGLELLQVLPDVETKHAIVHRVSLSNISLCAQLWNERKAFDVGAILRWHRSNPQGGLMGESPATTDIQLLDLIRELKEVVGWIRLGLHLGVPKHTLEVIRCQYAPYGEEMCKTEMLSTWLNSHTEVPTWAEVVSAVSRTGNKRVARKIANKYGLMLATLTEGNAAPEHMDPSAVKAGEHVAQLSQSDTLELLRSELEETHRAVEEKESQMQIQMQICARKKRRLEDRAGEEQRSHEIMQRFIDLLLQDKKTLEEKLAEKLKDIESLGEKQVQYEKQIRELEDRHAKISTKPKQRLKEKLKLEQQKKEGLFECIQSKQKEADKLRRRINKLELKLKHAKRELSSSKSQLESKTTAIDEIQRELEKMQQQRTELMTRLEKQEKALEEAVLKQQHDTAKTLCADKEWFFGNIDRHLAEKRCTQNGDYLVRYSSENMFALTCNSNGNTLHFIIQESTDDIGQTRYFFDRALTFPSIYALLEHHVKHSIPVTVDSKAILVKHIMKSDKLVLRHDDIDRVKKIGKGCFGDVYEGTLLTTGERIAIKKCRANAFENAEEFLSREAETLKQYDHQNVVKLIGVCTEKYPIYVVMEFMSGGTFLDFLCKLGVHQPKAKLCKMCIDVCSGMSYLESKKYVHRYLTAQNCLIGENDIVKISIFRISRVVQLEEGEIYVDQSMVRPIPIEWTAPEAQYHCNYTSSSDVWSFGVLLWEAFSCGSSPSPSRKGMALPPPANCSTEIYDIMRQCWQYNPNERPNFSTLLCMLKQAKGKFVNYDNVFKS